MPHPTLSLKYGTIVSYRKFSQHRKDDHGNPVEIWKKGVFLYQEGEFVRIRPKIGVVGGREIVVPRGDVSAE